MKNIYLALCAFAAVALASCSTVNYTHEAEDDVYFSSRTSEDIEVVYAPESESGEYGETTGVNRSYPLGNPRDVRTNRRTNDPNYCPPGGTNRSRGVSSVPTSRPSSGSTSGRSSSPSPTRGNRGSSGRTTTPQ